MKLIKSDPRLRKTKLYECQVYVRADMVPLQASERYYTFVGSNSFMPVSSLVEPEVGEAMLLVPKPLTEPMEFITDITNLKDEVHTVYLRLENSDKVEKDGQPLYRIVLYDFRDVEERHSIVENNLAKYRRFLSWSSYYFFEYEVSSEQFMIYKYIDEKAVKVVEDQLDAYFDSKLASMDMNDKCSEQIHRFVQYLKERKSSFEMELSNSSDPKSVSCMVKGGVMYKNDNQMVGLLIPMQTSEVAAYYLSPAAKDAATGLLNKRASAEYTLDRLSSKDNKTRWVIMMDIDDFKSINDTYGHLFGDLVIQRASHIMKQVVGRRGVIGRFGGDEFYILLEDVPTREKLKTLLKTMTKNFYYEFAPQFNMTVSIGIAQYPENGLDYETLIGMADKALYIAKEKGKNRHIIYDEVLHGTYETGNQRVKALSYTLSKEKRMEAVSELFGNLMVQGVEYLKRPGALSRLCEVMDIDAVALYTNFGDELFCASEGYAQKMPEHLQVLKDDRYIQLFDKYDIFVENSTVKMNMRIPEAYKEMKNRDIASTLQCIGRKDGVPYAWMTFDVLENSKKWNEGDIERLALLGKCCCKLLCEK